MTQSIGRTLHNHTTDSAVRCQKCQTALVRVVTGASHGNLIYRAVCPNDKCYAPQFVSSTILKTLPIKEGTINEFNQLVNRPFTI